MSKDVKKRIWLNVNQQATRNYFTRIKIKKNKINRTRRKKGARQINNAEIDLQPEGKSEGPRNSNFTTFFFFFHDYCTGSRLIERRQPKFYDVNVTK